MKIPVYSVVAWSGTGKTTFLEKLIPELKKRGLRIAVYKHDAHNFEIDKEGKDSYRITAAGADMTLLSCSSKAVIMENRPMEAEEMLSMVHDVDMILTEGFKFGKWKKIMLVRKGAGTGLAVDPKECFAIVSDVEIDTDTPVFDLNTGAGNLAEYIVKDLSNWKKEE